ncbi:hypothetical protein ACIGXM_26255 [Kitasatospora sp. NPDC052896]|uniref:hypothetical protein n=1 Tax=Kitasatospora sp. NPDC052896 TaxID=3364061 RepID=UPI0037C83E2E
MLALLPVGSAALALRLEDAGTPSAQARTRGQDAVWLGHAWVDGGKSAADLAALTRLMGGSPGSGGSGSGRSGAGGSVGAAPDLAVRDLYVHAGPLSDDGSLPASRYPRAGQLIAAVHQQLPGVRVQAWLGDLVEPEENGLNLDRADVRDRIAASVQQVLAAGFDGVHFDLEPVHSGSAGYLALLDQVHALTAARGVPLSVAAPQIDPLPGLHRVGQLVADHPKWWSQGYFGQVARRVDQIAVMSYDTGMPARSLYSGYVARQTTLALEATPASVGLVMGLPAYYADQWGHRGSAETVAAAVRGVRLALGRRATDRADRSSFGVGMYADFSASAADWAAYRRDWCGLPE